MAKKKTAKAKKPGMKKIFEVTDEEFEEIKKADDEKPDIKELRREVMEWGEKQIPFNIRRRPCGGCDVIVGGGGFRIKR